MASPEGLPHGILHLPNSPHPHEGRRVSIAVIGDGAPSKVNQAFEHDENGATNGHSPKLTSGIIFNSFERKLFLFEDASEI